LKLLDNMKVYEVIKDCFISYTKDGEDHDGFILYKGDFFFIEHDFCWVKKESRFSYEPAHSKESLLVKIYHNKLFIFGDRPEDIKYEWTWIENINFVAPTINRTITSEYFGKINPYTGEALCKDVTQQWEREEKLKEIISFK